MNLIDAMPHFEIETNCELHREGSWNWIREEFSRPLRYKFGNRGSILLFKKAETCLLAWRIVYYNWNRIHHHIWIAQSYNRRFVLLVPSTLAMTQLFSFAISASSVSPMACSHVFPSCHAKPHLPHVSTLHSGQLTHACSPPANSNGLWHFLFAQYFTSPSAIFSVAHCSSICDASLSCVSSLLAHFQASSSSQPGPLMGYFLSRTSPQRQVRRHCVQQMSSHSSSALPSAWENSSKQIPRSETDAFSGLLAGFTTFTASATNDGEDNDNGAGGGGNCTGGGESRRTIISNIGVTHKVESTTLALWWLSYFNDFVGVVDVVEVCSLSISETRTTSSSSIIELNRCWKTGATCSTVSIRSSSSDTAIVEAKSLRKWCRCESWACHALAPPEI